MQEENEVFPGKRANAINCVISRNDWVDATFTVDHLVHWKSMRLESMKVYSRGKGGRLALKTSNMTIRQWFVRQETKRSTIH